MVGEQVRSGRNAAEVVASVEAPEIAVFRWVREIGSIGLSWLATRAWIKRSWERRRAGAIAELEAELAAVKRASELLDEGRVVGGKALFPIVRHWPVRDMGPRRA